MLNFPLEVSETVSFEQAIALTQALLAEANKGKLSESEVAASISNLVKTANGARGFFVTYLTSDSSLADCPTPGILQALHSNSDQVADLLVKNLAMSTAQTIHHRQQNQAMAQGSEQVQRRTAQLISLLQLPEVSDRLQLLLNSATTGEGEYKAFLNRWGYDNAQKREICRLVMQVLPQ